MQPITLYGHATGANPWKVAIILEELNLPYTMKILTFAEMKEPEYLAINPNGKAPAIDDPNTGVTLWESCAIIQYLLENYDAHSTISFKTVPEKYQINQWLFFQASGQGPYFGQAIWFEKFHHEQVPSAKSRYRNEVLRILTVLNNALTGKNYLVGDKCTAADLAFITWASPAALPAILGDAYPEKGFGETLPYYQAWMDRLMAREKVRKVFADKGKIVGGKI